MEAGAAAQHETAQGLVDHDIIDAGILVAFIPVVSPLVPQAVGEGKDGQRPACAGTSGHAFDHRGIFGVVEITENEQRFFRRALENVFDALAQDERFGAPESRLIVLGHDAGRFQMHAEDAQRKIRAHLHRDIEDSAAHTLRKTFELERCTRVMLHLEREPAEERDVPFAVGAVQPRGVWQYQTHFLQASLQVGQILAGADLVETDDIGTDFPQCFDHGSDGLGGLGRSPCAAFFVEDRLQQVIADIPRGENDPIGTFRRAALGSEQAGQRGREDGARREHGASGRFVRLFVGSFFDVERGRGLFHFAIEFLAGFAEFVDALAETFGQFGKAFGAEENEDDEENEQDLRPSGSGEGEQRCHDLTLRPPAAGRNRECRHFW